MTWLPRLAGRKVRPIQVRDDPAIPAACQAALVKAAPAGTLVVQYEDNMALFGALGRGRLFSWLGTRLKAAGPWARRLSLPPGCRESSPTSMTAKRMKMKKYRGWPAFPTFLSDYTQAALSDTLVTPPAAAILGYSKVSIRRILEHEDVQAWAWYEADQFHPSEVFVSVRSLVRYGLRKGRLGDYEDEVPLRAVLDRDAYERLRQEIRG